MHSLKDFSAILTENAPLAPLTTFRIGGPARYLFEPENETQLRDVMAWLESAGVEYRILGGGSNVLVDDAGCPCAVLRLGGELAGISIDARRVAAGAGALLARLVAQCAGSGLSGAEGLAGIPGTVGGALVMNAGGRHGQIGALVRRVRVFDAGGARDLERTDIDFGYRRSSLAGALVVSAEFELQPFPEDAVTAAMRKVLVEKCRQQPLSAASAGCVFKNPPDGPPAGKLIEDAGLKGACVGGAKVSELHANYIVNAGSATAADVRGLIERIREAVFAQFGVDLGIEIELW